MTASVGALHDGATHALELLSGRPAVRICLDGLKLVVAADINAAEHDRRSSLDISAVTSLGLLHSLWLLPRGIPVAEDQIPPRKREALRAAEHFAAPTADGFSRTYEPAATVRSVAFVGAQPDRLVERAIRFSPIFERWAIVERGRQTVSTDAVALAARWGVGLATVSGDEVDEMVVPAPAVVGQPAVYRWWIGELAYEGLLQSSTQLVS